MINFLPNDPLAGAPPTRETLARPDRKSDQAGFSVSGNEPEKVYEAGTAGFLRWQARQAATLAVETWEAVLDQPIVSWAQALDDPTMLLVVPDGGTDLNAFYDRASISFFHHTGASRTTFSAASTDVVAHETGHAVLDALRPDLWDTNMLEVGGLHEAFGDITAIITALADRETRTALLAVSPDLGAANFVEATAEDLSEGVRLALGPGHPASKPRRALNTFRWQLPVTMPRTGGPDDMIGEVHSIARIFTGCFYDLLRGLFAGSEERTEDGLWAATKLAGQLVWFGAAAAPEVPRFFRAVGRQMVLADSSRNNGANRAVIGRAFAGHGIALGSQALLAPELALAGAAPRFDPEQGTVEVEPATVTDLRRRLGAGPEAQVEVSMLPLDDTAVAKVTFQTEVPLDEVDDRLRGVITYVNVPALVGESGRAAALLHAPRPEVPTEETQQFVRGLIASDQLEFEPTDAPDQRRTHAVEQRDGRRELHRVRFSC
jgi:hypothetical protein